MPALFALIDCARDPGLVQLVKRSPAYACLFAGRPDPATEAVSPFLVDLSINTQLRTHWETQGWGRNWGVIVHSDHELEDLRRHFRQFLLAELPDARKVMFRFYDPRVLRPFLPTCTTNELALWFSKVSAFVMEGESGASLTYSFDGQSLLVGSR